MIEIEAGSFVLNQGVVSWHGIFSFIAVGAAVFLVGRWAPSRGVDPDDIYSIAVWAIIGGILGARFVHVIDNLDYYSQDIMQVFAVWSGGGGLWGGVLGGTIAGLLYCLIRHHPFRVIADMTAPAMLFVQSIGRLGDIVNGEHCAKATSQFFGFIWNHPTSAAGACAPNGIGVSVQPVIAMEILWNSACLFLIWKLKDRLRPAGALFSLYLALYSIGRFFITFLRDDKVWAYGLQEAQFISILILAITVPILVAVARIGDKDIVMKEFSDAVPTGTRAERRRE